MIEIVEALHSVNRCKPFDTDGASAKSGIQDQARSAICCVYCTADVARRCSRQCIRARDTVLSGTIYLSWSHKEFKSYTLCLWDSGILRLCQSMSTCLFQNKCDVLLQVTTYFESLIEQCKLFLVCTAFDDARRL